MNRVCEREDGMVPLTQRNNARSAHRARYIPAAAQTIPLQASDDAQARVALVAALSVSGWLSPHPRGPRTSHGLEDVRDARVTRLHSDGSTWWALRDSNPRSRLVRARTAVATALVTGSKAAPTSADGC